MAVKATPPLAGAFRASGPAVRAGPEPAGRALLRRLSAALARGPTSPPFGAGRNAAASPAAFGAARQASLRSTTERPGEEVAETLPDLRRHLDPIDLRRQLRRPLVGGQVGATRRAFAQVRL